MSDNKEKPDEKWVTVGGQKIALKSGEDINDKLEGKKDLRGEKGKNTKETKKYIKREGLFKSRFDLRDTVVFNKYENSGMVVGVMGDMVKISQAPNNKIVVVDQNMVFKTSELLSGGVHWDTLDPLDRINYLDKCHLSPTYINKNWEEITKEIRNVIKINNPAGDSYGSDGTMNPIYNPIENNKTLSDRIQESLDEGEEGDKDEKTD